MGSALLRWWGGMAPLILVVSLSACTDWFHDHASAKLNNDGDVLAPLVDEPDTTPPQLISTTPPAGARGATLAGPVGALFNEALDAATVNVSSFTLSGPAGRVDGDVSLQGNQALFTPRLPLAIGVDYTANLSVAIRDAAGNPLAAAQEWRFNTGGNRLAAGFAHACLRADSGKIKCWGDNSFGQLGLGDNQHRGDAAGELGDNLPVVDLGGRAAVEAVNGNFHSCARLDDGTVKCWGYNSNGQLGSGDTQARGDAPGEMGSALPAANLGSGRSAAQLVAGGAHTCARLDNGAVKCWGSNSFGQLGLGDTVDRGVLSTDMGDRLPAVDLGTGRFALELAAGGTHTCARLDNGAVKCWGYNLSGQLGIGDRLPRGDGRNEMGDRLPVVNLGTGRSAVQLAVGPDHNCALLDDASVKCWGENAFGQLGVRGTFAQGDETGEMGDKLFAVNLGSNRGALGVAVGLQHSCAILDDGTVKCWGGNAAGQLGIGDIISRGSNSFEMGDNLAVAALGGGRRAAALVAGARFNCAYLDNGAVKCWGLNDAGQLGLGDTANRGDAPGEMGDALGAADLGAL